MDSPLRRTEEPCGKRLTFPVNVRTENSMRMALIVSSKFTRRRCSQPSSASMESSHRPPSIVRFNHQSAYAGFMNHSAHRVLFRNQTYLSAAHLHEAFKYLEHRPDLAENIRNCRDVKEVYPLSARYQRFQRPDWAQVFLQLVR